MTAVRVKGLTGVAAVEGAVAAFVADADAVLVVADVVPVTAAFDFAGFAHAVVAVAAAVIVLDVAVVECYSAATRFLAAYSAAYGWDAAAAR
jgi:hypothetical protein